VNKRKRKATTPLRLLVADEEKEEKHFSKLGPSDKVRDNINVTQTSVISQNTAIQSSFYENTSGTLAVKMENSKFIQTLRFERCWQMNSLEILQALRHLSVRYANVYPADRLPRVWTRSIAIIANTYDHDRPSQHWVAFYIDEYGTGTYFDNYELPLLDSRFLLRFRRNSTTHRWNTMQPQGMLFQTCRQYCCLFLYFMFYGYNLNQFFNLFDNNYERNDHLIVKLFRKIFLPSKNECVKSHVVCCHVKLCTFKSKT